MRPAPYRDAVLRFLLAPRWLALHAATVAAIAGTLILGSWQMRAYVEQEEREQTAAANQAADAPTASLEDVVPVGQALPVDAVGRPVTTEGAYDAARTVLLPGRELAGDLGYTIVTPLVAPDGTVTPVLRGWVADVDSPRVPPPPGEVSLRGVVQPLEVDADAAVDPTVPLPPGQLPALTSVAVFRTYPYPPETIRQAQVVVSEEQPAQVAAPTRVPVDEAAPRPVGVSAWRHLSYAWQWWLFAVAAVAFWAAFVRSGIRDERAAASQSDAPSHQGLP